MSRTKNDCRRRRRKEKQRGATVELAERRNRPVADLADEIIVAHASPGGQLEGLCRELVGAIARCEGITRARVAQIMMLLRLARETQERILRMPRTANPPRISERSPRPYRLSADLR